MKSIPFYSLHVQHQLIEKETKSVFADLFNDGRFILASRLKNFEEEFAHYTGGKYCIGVANGLDALYISLKILGISEGDEVIVPSHTYIATWLAVSRAGAVPVPVEVDEQSWLIDVDRIESAITSKTKAILPVHLYGLLCDMKRIKSIADKHQLKIVEDNAQATGASLHGKQSGTWGNANAFSFYPTKTLGALGDGGAIITDDEEVYKQALAYRNYGSVKQFVNEYKGVNSRLDEMQAAFLSIKLKYLNQWNDQRKHIASIYHDQLKDVAGLEMPVPVEGSEPVYHLFPVKVRERNKLIEHLNLSGIETSIHYPTPPYLQKAYYDLGIRKGSFPFTEDLSAHIVSLPIWPGLAEDNVLRICDEVRNLLM
jgi:dTDP-4-amino-4,6-dideoxygalactose transaminase